MNDLPSLCERVLKTGLVMLIAFTPFAFGTVEPWSIALMEWGVTTLLLVFLLARLWPTTEVRPATPRLTGLELPIGLFIVLCVLQTVPMPLRWLNMISPGSAGMYQKIDWPPAAPAVDSRGGVAPDSDSLPRLDLPDRRPVSVYPTGTWHRLRLLAAFAALFLLVSAWADRADRILFGLISVTIVGFLVAVHGLVQFLTWNGKMFWVRKVASVSVFGPFVNHNHFAGYVEMVIPVAISLATYFIEVGRRPDGTRRIDRGLWGTDGRSRLGQGVLALFASLILVGSLFFSQSRAGILAAVIGGVVFFVLLWRRIASRSAVWSVGIALPVLVSVLIAWIGADVVTRRLETYSALKTEASFRLRLIVWDSVLRNLPRYHWFGSGLGTFEESFAPLTPPGSAARWDMAHNDYLQLLWETGVVGGAIVLFGGLVFAWRYWWPALRSRGHPLHVFRVGLAVALLSIALHSCVDFSLQIGANGFLCALIAGLLVALDRVAGREMAAQEAGIGGG